MPFVADNSPTPNLIYTLQFLTESSKKKTDVVVTTPIECSFTRE